MGNLSTVNTSASRYSAVETGQSAYFRINELIIRRSEIDWKQMWSALICRPKRARVNRLVCATWAGELNSLYDSVTRGFKQVTFKLNLGSELHELTSSRLMPEVSLYHI